MKMFICAVPSTAAREKVAFAKARCHKFHRWPVLLRDAMRMSDDENKDEGILAPTEDNYEAIASQEELYLEEAEENLRAILTSNKRLPSRTAESLNEQLDHAAEELITGAADDARLSEEAVADVLRMTLNAPRFDGCDR